MDDIDDSKEKKRKVWSGRSRSVNFPNMSYLAMDSFPTFTVSKREFLTIGTTGGLSIEGTVLF